MKKLLLTFEDSIDLIPKQCIFHNTEDMIDWLTSKSDIFVEFKIINDNVIAFNVQHVWKGLANFEYIEAFL